MNILKFFLLAATALFLYSCKTTQPTAPTVMGASVLGVARTLDTTYGKFYELAKANPGKTPQQIVAMTADWLKTQPNVQKAHWFDSTVIDITLKSGLRTTFMLNLMDKDSMSITRGGGSGGMRGHARGRTSAPANAKNFITNKNVLIYSPFGACGKGSVGNFYTAAELAALVNVFSAANNDFNVTLVRCSDCTVKTIDSFGDYGLVLMDTHGLPDGFLSGNRVLGLSDLLADTNDAAIKMTIELDDHLGGLGSGGYDKVLNGMFRFASVVSVLNVQGWQTFLETKTQNPIVYRVVVNSEYINTLPSMPNTVLLANMCYSGWSRPGGLKLPNGSEYEVTEPIQTAFMNRDLLSYYSYGFDDGTAAPVGNMFASIMEDSLVHALVVDGDSTGNAFLSSSGKEYTGRIFNDYISPDMPFRHAGAEDYSYEKCVDTLIDERDGRKYKAVCIGGQTWMAENLNYNAPGTCYEESSENCATFGRLYDWNTMMKGEAPSSANPSNVRGICPKGWHIPSMSEWIDLIVFADSKDAGGHGGYALRSKSLWNKAGGTDTLGFNGLPGGEYSPASGYGHLFESGSWWSSSKLSSSDNYEYMFLTLSASAAHFYAAPEKKYSCRCVKD